MYGEPLASRKAEIPCCFSTCWNGNPLVYFDRPRPHHFGHRAHNPKHKTFKCCDYGIEDDGFYTQSRFRNLGGGLSLIHPPTRACLFEHAAEAKSHLRLFRVFKNSGFSIHLLPCYLKDLTYTAHSPKYINALTYVVHCISQ